MNDFRTILAAGAIVNAALYLSGVVAVGLVERNGFAVRLAITALWVSYLAYLVQLSWSENQLGGVTPVWGMVIRVSMVWGSIVFGATAGLALL